MEKVTLLKIDNNCFLKTKYLFSSSVLYLSMCAIFTVYKNVKENEEINRIG